MRIHLLLYAIIAAPVSRFAGTSAGADGRRLIDAEPFGRPRRARAGRGGPQAPLADQEIQRFPRIPQDDIISVAPRFVNSVSGPDH
jgi:hypothetical protein